MKEIYTSGKRGAVVCIEIEESEHSIVASADAEKITESPMKKALKREYPQHVFSTRIERGYIIAQADAP